MKKVLGLDLGTNSIGWALVKEAEEKNEHSSIIKLGVRVIRYDNFNKVDKVGNVSESKNPIDDFKSGKGLSPNAKRTKSRSARRNLQRFKLRRKNLIEILVKYSIINKDTLLTESGKNTTHQTLELRSKSAKEKIPLEAFARVLLAINKKRGYKSSRKVKSEDEGVSVDGMAIAKEIYEKQLTPGHYVYKSLQNGKKYIPDFYQSDLQAEFDTVWNKQKHFYPATLTDEFYKKLKGQGQQNSRKLFLAVHQVYTAENKGKRDEKKLQHYKWRSEAITKQLSIEEVAYVLVEINNNINKSSGYLGAISDRSKELYFNNETVGEYLYNKLLENPHVSLKNQVFYRQDYLDEFETIWETQAKYHKELTNKLKEEIRDIVIFYQRKLKSQKHLISECQFEKHHKVIPKSSPLFQEFKIWQNLNHLVFKNTQTKEEVSFVDLDEETRHLVFEELNLKGSLKMKNVKNIIGFKAPNYWKANFDDIEGNRTNEGLFNAYKAIAEDLGYGFNWEKKTAYEIKTELKAIFVEAKINTDILQFDTDTEGNTFDKQKSYQLWHILYSAEDTDKASEEDKLVYGNIHTKLKKKLNQKFGFEATYGSLLTNISFQQDYGNLSAKAIKKILPHLKSGNSFSQACALNGYNHSNALTKEESENRNLKDKLTILPKNSLRNPVVEKILNQMVNLINQVIDAYGKPKEVRIELARELKKSAKQRDELTKHINDATLINQNIRVILQKEFGVKHPTRNDIIRYKLYEELKDNGYKTLFTNQYIPRERLFTGETEIEHIIPKAILFDDSFSNKTLAYSDVNRKKGDSTALDFIANIYSDELENYKARVEALHKAKKISKGKYKKLLMARKDLPNDFIERDLRNSQYIAKKATQMLQEVFRTVTPTSGRITDKLREDWNLINVMQELNLPKYKTLGLTETQERKKGNTVERIIDWTKRNDHRHHAMDALTVAFTTNRHIQYLNNLNTAHGLDGSEIDHEKSKLYRIKKDITKLYKSGNTQKRKFIPPSNNFRSEAKKHLETILISFKNKNKVVSKNKNRIKTGEKGVTYEKVQLTPRGQLHKETVYGHVKKEIITTEKVSNKFTIEKIQWVTKPSYRKALLKRLETYENNPKKAFSGKNSLQKNPLYIDSISGKKVPESVKLKSFQDVYVIRKEVNPENFTNSKSLEKIIDVGIRRILQKRLEKYGEKAKEAFSNLDKNPIWRDDKKKVAIKKVRIEALKNAESLHTKKDHTGHEMLNETGKNTPVDFVSTGNNHHVAIYCDSDGKLHDEVVSFYEAVSRVNLGIPIIDESLNSHLGWKFLFTMKQNEMFVFPSDEFNPKEVDLENPKNNKFISKHLFRVQKFSKVTYGNSAVRDYVFRHHLETELIDKKELKGIAYYQLKSIGMLEKLVKVRINHIGKIVQVGEY
ncbi:CRISPR-associated endonuclease Cas9 [Kordia sp. SMS9]|uniref:type II CRISPR RNA-guided endonuclease Cas9 n=1 Tax=Kordia sp. SMS9 TaxID=2282170 RepID=UPI000E0CF99E|nr:type II CRISPR RNA-guided endonuclease Cas9 [Kordia sp. SMS9]AXG70022.1 CRISPR-associated endonuclease Cas9 [Kordia sp. SMS9]